MLCIQFASLDSQEYEGDEVPDSEVDANHVEKLLADNPIDAVCSATLCVSGADMNSGRTTYAMPI